MAEIWKPLAPEVYKSWVQAIIDEASDELNAWEMKFIADMETRLACGGSLTESQAKKLEQIYSEKTE